MVITIAYNGSPMVITYTGKIDKAKMEGEADYGGLATGTWSATAQKQVTRMNRAGSSTFVLQCRSIISRI